MGYNTRQIRKVQNSLCTVVLGISTGAHGLSLLTLKPPARSWQFVAVTTVLRAVGLLSRGGPQWEGGPAEEAS
jgi:hypothetical protein